MINKLLCHSVLTLVSQVQLFAGHAVSVLNPDLSAVLRLKRLDWERTGSKTARRPDLRKLRQS